MKRFIKTILILFYLCLAIFITPNENYNIHENTKNQSIISQSKSDIIAINKINEHYFASPSHPETQLLNSTNKNSDLSFGFNDSILTKNFLRYLFYIENTGYLSQISYNIPLNLKNSVYTRAP